LYKEVDESGDIFLTVKQDALTNKDLAKRYDTTEMEIGKSFMVSIKAGVQQESVLIAVFACYYP